MNDGEQRMRFLIFGAGAIGTYIGGSLATHGYPVVFLDTPETVQKIKAAGMQLKIQESVDTIDSPDIFGSLQACLTQGAYDAAVFAIKSFDTEAALEEINPFKEKMPPILCLQNGVENEQKIAEVLGEGRVISGTVTSAVGRLPSGEVTLERLRGVGISAKSSISGDLLNALNQSGLNARLFKSGSSMKWSKLLTNLLSNASSAILKMSPAEVFSEPMLFRMEVEQLREALQVMKAMRITAINLPGTPVRALAFAARSLPLIFAQPLLQKAVGGGRGAKMPSLYLDLHSGRGQSEVDFLNGAIVRYGEKYGVATPVNRLLNETLLGMLSGAIQISSFAHRPQKLVDLWQELQSNLH